MKNGPEGSPTLRAWAVAGIRQRGACCVMEDMPAALGRSKVALSLREMSGRLGRPKAPQSPGTLHACERLISTERDDYSAGASSVSLMGLNTSLQSRSVQPACSRRGSDGGQEWPLHFGMGKNGIPPSGLDRFSKCLCDSRRRLAHPLAPARRRNSTMAACLEMLAALSAVAPSRVVALTSAPLLRSRVAASILPWEAAHMSGVV